MGENVFTPALGRFAPTRFYDGVVALTRERVWRSLVVMYVAPRAGDTIVDVGCGTGSLALLLNRVEPGASLVGVDPDATVLQLVAVADVERLVRTPVDPAVLVGPGAVAVVVRLGRRHGHVEVVEPRGGHLAGPDAPVLRQQPWVRLGGLGAPYRSHPHNLSSAVPRRGPRPGGRPASGGAGTGYGCKGLPMESAA
jgi:SAM-dependent methyltransferase